MTNDEYFLTKTTTYQTHKIEISIFGSSDVVFLVIAAREISETKARAGIVGAP